MTIFSVLQQMSKLFLMILAGYIANRTGILGRDAQKWLSKLLIYITSPALVLASVTTCSRFEDDHMLLVIFIAAIAYYVLLPVIARLCSFAAPKERRAEYEVMLVYSNMLFMGLPVANAVLGSDSILYLSIFVAAHNVSFFTYAYMRLSTVEGEKHKLPFKKVINPGTVSAVLAVAMYICRIHIPSLLLDPISTIGSTTTPLAMMVIGASLANSRMKDMLNEKSMIFFTLLRLVLLAGLAWCICRLFISDRMLAGIIVLITGMPVAANNVMLCNDLGRDADYMAKGVFFSTLFSVLTIPVLSLLL